MNFIKKMFFYSNKKIKNQLKVKNEYEQERDDFVKRRPEFFSFHGVLTGDDPDKHITRPAKQIRAVIKASGVTFTPHDCRRTFATIAEAVSLPMSMIKRLMNHVTTNDVTGGYIVTEEET